MSTHIKSGLTRRRTLRAATLAPMAALAAPAIVHAQAAKRIRFAHAAPTAHGWHLWAEQFKKSIEAKTGGRIEVQIFPNA